MDLADIVNQHEQPPLYIHFLFGAKGKAIHLFLHTNAGEGGFHDPQPSGIDPLASIDVDLCLHLIDQVGGRTFHLNGKIAAGVSDFFNQRERSGQALRTLCWLRYF